MQINAHLFEVYPCFCISTIYSFKIIQPVFLLTEKLVYFSTVYIPFSDSQEGNTLHGFSMPNFHDIVLIRKGIGYELFHNCFFKC